jgi:uncharacterized protein
MKYLLAKKPLFLLFFVLLSGGIIAQDFPPIPNPPRLVTDFTGTLSADEVARLEQKLVAYNDSTSTQIAIVMMRSTGEYEIADYSQRFGEN